jgi:putative hydrolase of the HAD superfamily
MVKAILLDALGTLIGFENPAPHLQSELQRRGHPVSLEEAERAIRAEITYYRAHLHQGRDAASLHDLRVRCAAAMGLDGVPTETALDALLAALRFFAHPDSAPTLLALRERGIRLVVVSNWDFSLHERLAETGLTPLLDGALASAEVGSAKPDGAIFRAALQLTGTTPEQTWHVGDTPAADVEGARAAGLHPVLIARDGERPPGAVRSLAELIPLAAT